MFPEEKTEREVAVMRFLTDETNVPVPLVLHSGTAEESPEGLGPFIIMEFVEHECDLADGLKTPDVPYEERPVLNPDYSKHTFPKIGRISSTDDGDSWVVSHRPLTLNMNELVQLGNVSPDALPQGPFETSTSYYVALADMHLEHLKAQRVGVVQVPDEFRQKYIARCLFRKMAREGLLLASASSRWRRNNSNSSSSSSDKGPFPLFNDDFRPANVWTTSNFEVTGALGWEFTYAAPPEFAHGAPLLELPEYWPEGLDDASLRKKFSCIPSWTPCPRERRPRSNVGR